MTLTELRPLSVGEILDTSFGLYRRYFAPLAMIVIVVSAVPTVIELYLQASGGMVAHPVVGILNGFLNITLSAIGTAAAVFVVSDSYLGREVGAREALHRALPYVWRIIGLSVLTTLVVGMGFLLLLIPGLIFLSALMVSTQALVLEPDLTAVQAMNRSWQLTKGYRLKTLALIVVTGFLVAIPSTAGGIISALLAPGAGVLADPAAMPLGWYLVVSIAAIAQMLLYPLMYAVVTVLYYDLRVRKEGFDLDILAQALEAN